MSKSFLDSMLPNYPQFQPFTSSQLTSLIHLNNNNILSQNNINSIQRANNGLNLSTSESGSLANSEDGISNSPSVTDTTTAAYKMYPYVSNHPSSHTSLSGMPGFSGLEDKSCR